MILRKEISFLAFCIVWMSIGAHLSAQDVQFSQAYANPLLMNPGFAGDTYLNRISLSYRNQWTGLPAPYTSYAASYDHHFKKSNNGLGFTALNDESGIQGYRLREYAAFYSQGVKTGIQSGIRAGVKVGMSTLDHDRDRLFFWDQVVRGDAPNSIETQVMESVNYLDVSSGAMYYKSGLWFGYSATHLNRPKYSLYGTDLALPVHHSIHMGAKIRTRRPVRNQTVASVSPMLNFKWQQDWQQLDLGMYWTKKPILLGIWYRGLPIKNTEFTDYRRNEAIILLIGIDVDERFRLGYSYDVTISPLAGGAGGSHEISLTYEWPNKLKDQRKLIMPCPRF